MFCGVTEIWYYKGKWHFCWSSLHHFTTLHSSHLFSTLKKTLFLQHAGSGWFLNKCHNHNPWPPPHFFLVIFLEGLVHNPQVKSWGIVFCWCTPHHFSVVTRDEWCLHTSLGARVSGSQAPGSIKGGASHSGYWATGDEGPSHGSPLAAIFG